MRTIAILLGVLVTGSTISAMAMEKKSHTREAAYRKEAYRSTTHGQ
jgi:hypothetical protein